MRFVTSMSCVALIALAASTGHAQFRSHRVGPEAGSAQAAPVARQGPLPALGGVPSAAPGPSQFFAQPQYRPMQVAPWPGAAPAQQYSNPSSFSPGEFPRNPNSRGVYTNPGAGVTSSGYSGSGVYSGSGYYSGSGRGYASSSGLTVNGYYNSDHFRLAFHLGSPICTPYGYHNRCGVPAIATQPTWWYGDYDPCYSSYYGGPYGNQYGTIYGFYSEPDPAMSNVPRPQPAPTTEAVVPSTNRELADTYLRAGDPRAAIKAYQAHLKQYPGDEDAMRSLGLALIDAGQIAEGVAMVAMAYKAEPLLCDRPVSSAVFRYGDDGLTRNLSRASIYANRVKSASGWLTLAVLMQAQGRNELATSMVERARGAGLESAVADRMISALR